MVRFTSIYEMLCDTAARHGDSPLFAMPLRMAEAWGTPTELTYSQVVAEADRLAAAYSARGCGEGDVIGLAFDQRPAMMLHYYALNRLGACILPINTELAAPELAYILDHSRCCAIVGLESLGEPLRSALAVATNPIPLAFGDPSALPEAMPDRWRFGCQVDPLRRIAALLYTSGTTGRPKGCMLTNCYALASGQAYGSPWGEKTLRAELDRVLNPLPLFHMNTLMLTAGGVVDCGACLVLPGRFSLSNWWSDIRETGATRFHYLGLMIPALMSRPASAQDREHRLNSGLGAGVDPAHHAAFEERFGVPLHEVWGMTEVGRGLFAAQEPRHVDSRACGRPRQGILARIVREDGSTAPDGEAGELVVRADHEDPRYGFFAGYLHDPEATEEAWEGGWFRTGDICTRAPDGMFFFVDRKKNIIRRSGENIASAEVEGALLRDPRVAQVAVLAVPDRMRDEEVMACIVPKAGAVDAGTAAEIVEAARAHLASFKLPGWIYYLESLPVTGTQKVQKHRIFPEGFSESLALEGLVDCRPLKHRRAVPARA
ncbi:MAG: ATP-dependent acyl-CoA ligase [Rhodobacteraceae bacterium]|nr:ATP-dependent acyl-CoA ligase [Paracoccaceae bacterium]MBR9823582.1 ATP-dependent acyl-CoA ligase [Paracoccaceae bacterium]